MDFVFNYSNPNSAGPDTTAPTVTITSTESNGTPANPIPIAFTLSEVSTNFAIGNVTVGAGGTLGNFAGSGTAYTADLTVTTASATITLDIAGGAFTDAAGNGNTAATQFSITSSLLVLDNFTDTVAAGAVNATAATPGPGTRTATDTESKMSVGSGVLSVDKKASPAFGDPGLWYGTSARAAGKVAMIKQYLANFTGVQRVVGWDTSAAGDTAYGIAHLNGGGIATNQLTITTLAPLTLNDVYFALVQRGTGMFYLMKGGGQAALADWTLLWVQESGNDANLLPASSNNSKTTTVEYYKAAQLATPWTTDNGIATQVLTGARTAGDAFAHEANCLIFFTVTTLPSAGNIELRFRIVDSTNYWQILIDSSGNYTLNSVVAGTPTARLGPTSGVTNGMRIGIRFTTATIWVHKGAATGASVASVLMNSATGGGLLNDEGTGGSVTLIEAWPYSLSSAALTQLTNLNHNIVPGFQINSATMTNAASRMTIPNGETDPALINQVVHPDVCRPNPAGKWNGYTYWMAIEPYPESDEAKENPYILVSDDMDAWITPAGGSNPVVAAPGGGVYNNDGDLFYDSDADTLYLVYGQSNGTSYQKIYVISSTDGITWGAPTLIVDTTLTGTVSPSIVKTAGGTFEMYAVSTTAIGEHVEVRTCATMTGTWSAATVVMNRTPYSDPQLPWHIDVYLENGNYLALITIHNTGDYLYLAGSQDGRKWQIADDPLMYHSVSGWDNLWLYRGTIGIRTATGFDVIYSAKSNDGAGDWGAGRTQLTIGVV